MALFAKTSNTIETTGTNIPIPFSETEASPDNVSERYTNTPNKKRFVKILRRPITNCNFLLLNKKIPINDNAADKKKSIGIIFSTIVDDDKRFIEKTTSLAVLHKLNTKVKPPEMAATNNRYID